jgi:hypothetical protein
MTRGRNRPAGRKLAKWISCLRNFLALAVLAGCQPAVTPVAPPTPEIMVVQVTPALRSLDTRFEQCAKEQPGAGLVLLDTPASAVDLDRSPLALRWGADPAFRGFAAVIGQEALAVIVHPGNPTSAIPVEELRAIYLGTLHAWKSPVDPLEIQPWAYSAGSDTQAIFEAALESKIAPHAASTAPDPAAMREAVAGSTAAVGFLPRRWLDASVKEITVTGLDPQRGRQPIIAVSKSEPKGPIYSWLLCLQKELP